MTSQKVLFLFPNGLIKESIRGYNVFKLSYFSFLKLKVPSHKNKLPYRPRNFLMESSRFFELKVIFCGYIFLDVTRCPEKCISHELPHRQLAIMNALFP